MRKGITLGIVALLVIATAFAGPYLHHLLGAGTGIVAKTVCSGIYVMGRDKSDVIAQDTAHYPDIFDIDINELSKIVNVAAGWREASAQHYPGIGCVRTTEAPSPNIDAPSWASNNPADADTLPEPAWPEGGTPDPLITSKIDREALQRVIAKAFDDADGEAPVKTRAVAIVWQGQLVAERYADGFTKTTPLMGWSMSKSITNALIGMRISDGALALNDTALLPQWQAADDPRADITLDALLRMSSGLEFSENYFNTNSDAVSMLFGANGNNMGGYAASRPLEHPVDSHWSYSSGTTNILQRILRNTFSNTHDYLDYVHSRLLQPLGMHHTQLEPDATGTLVGSSFGYASARDWARFGQLFLQDGRWKEQQLLPDNWVTYSTTPTPTAPEGNYGAHWWINQGPADNPAARPWPKLPQSAYRASGFEGQTVMILPEQELIVVRLGLTVYPANFDFETFVAGVIKALES